MDEAIIMQYFLDEELDLHNLVHNLIQNEEVGDHHNVPGRAVPTFNQEYVSQTVYNYSLSEFKSHFRMTRNAVEAFCILIAPHIQERQLFISLEEKVLYFIWVISKQESFLASSDRFGFAKGTGHYIFMKILSATVLLKDNFIQWPNERQCAEIATRIENRSRIPGVVGAIDGCHIIIKQPVNNAVDFYNRKEQHSIILQAVCDDRKLFTDVFIGMPGRVHDARVFRTSPLYDRLTGNPPLLQADKHIIGDAAYPLLSNLIKPFRDNGHLTERQTTFNRVFSAQRSVIERTFALLKGKWRRLKYLDMSVADKIPQVILAACIMHNFLLKRQDEDYDDYDDNNYDRGQEDHMDNNGAFDNEFHNNGTLKRDYIATLLE